jgi:hypothetical protein
VAPASTNTSGFNFSSFAVSPANDAAVSLNILNGAFPSGVSPNTTTRWVGIPALLRNDTYGANGWIPLLSYAPSTNSDGGYASFRTPISLTGDVNISQLWQYGVQASHFLYSDTGFVAMPNGSTLFAGQILAPPSYWSGANGKRYAVDVVYQTGTTGTPNSGATTCTGTAATSVLTCSSATDLSAGQRISIGTDTNKTISYVNATNSAAVLVNLTSNLGSTYSTATALSFSAPVLGPEIQMPTKSSAAPATLAWSQGDMEQNSAATANGVAAWVNVAAGTPGTWAGIPLGNSSGQIATSQISNTTGSGNAVLATSPTVNGLTDTGTTSLTTASVSGTTTLNNLVLNGTCVGTACAASTTIPGWLTNLGTGADGSCVIGTLCSPSGITGGGTSAATGMGDFYFTNFTLPAGDTFTVNNQMGLTIHATGTCTINGTMLANGNYAAWSYPYGGSTGGGGGGGAAAGTAGGNEGVLPSTSGTAVLGGSAGAASGGAGGNGSTPSVSTQRRAINAGVIDGQYMGGSAGGQGGSTGGAGGNPGGGITLICGSIVSSTGVINVSGAAGTAASANSTGSGGGGGGGSAILSSQAAVSSWPTIYAAGGPGALATVPQALGVGGSCTTQPKATLGVTSGALNGTCTVVQAGAGCGTGTGLTWSVVGGGGTLGTGTVNPTWSGGALASCTATAGTSSGYTAATYTTSGAGGDGGNGWSKKCTLTSGCQ